MLQMILAAVQDLSNPAPSHVTPHVKQLLSLLEGEMSREELQRLLALKDRKSFNDRYLQPALAAQVIAMTLPDKPKSRLQKYRLTELGLAQLTRQ